MSNKVKILLFLVSILFFVSVVYFTFQNFIKVKDNNEEISYIFNENNFDSKVGKKCDFYSSIENLCLESEEKLSNTAIAIMVENHVEARPVSGINQASIVYEILAEGGITRFLAIFKGNKEVEKIGPIRSSRQYFIDILEPFKGIAYGHVGGSPEALNTLKNNNNGVSYNQFFNDSLYWRDNTRLAPHNVYTRLSNEGWEEKTNQKLIFPEFVFNTSSVSKEDVKSIEIDFSKDKNYSVYWEYVTSSSTYKRYEYIKGEKYEAKTADDGTFLFSNILVLKMKKEVLDKEGRLRITNVGEGSADFFIGGEYFKGKRQRQNKNEHFKFILENGDELKFNPGKTWVSIIPPEGKIIFY